MKVNHVKHTSDLPRIAISRPMERVWFQFPIALLKCWNIPEMPEDFMAKNVCELSLKVRLRKDQEN